MTRSRYNTRVADVEGLSNTLRASYRSGYKLYSQFVPMDTDTDTDTSHGPEADPPPPRFRFFTPRECARLQGFPDSFQLSGDDGSGGGDMIPESAQYTAVGNAVAPPLVAEIGKALLAAVM
jgi:site-specific DNA-cytosine methylase